MGRRLGRLNFFNFEGNCMLCIPSLVFRPFLLLACAGFAVGSDAAFYDAVSGVSENCPEWILGNQVLIDVVYWGFDGELHKGALVADNRVVNDLQLVFLQMLLLGFPLESVVPISEYGWDDSESTRQNNTSAFNYRCVAGTDRLSRHAYGLAIDINPVQNPYCSNGNVSSEGAEYDPQEPGTLYRGHPVVELFSLLGWRWGGDWSEKDYQHFDKPLEDMECDCAHHIGWLFWRLLKYGAIPWE
jgi:peptidoglycan L-alanyl-D-glutamate endopeptidase CwlK